MLRILLVEPHPDTAESCVLLLRCWGFDVCQASTGPAVLLAAADFRPDVVLIELRLPNGDGFELARRLRQIEGLSDLRIVALTCLGQEHYRRRSQAEGFFCHLLKPTNPEDLRCLLEAEVTTSRSRHESPTSFLGTLNCWLSFSPMRPVELS